ncbi:MAG: oxygen-insensitive NADPH nitroreductase [Gorillibacterium sp.]|nr:oxygen-insensitive NADPH nitroreductase [Gorillibacterium sp.]
MNETIRLLNGHRSIRQFTKEPIAEHELEAIITAAQTASTSSGVQAYSVIAVTDPKLQKELSVLCGNQAYVEECPVFLVWCADLQRLKTAVQISKGDEVEIASTTENFLIATIDTTLAAQNAAIAAESLGYGIVYIGGIRNQIAEVTKLLGLPELVYPVFGMCVGKPDQAPHIRPRLPQKAVLHRNRYDASIQENLINEYDEIYKAYISSRSNGAACSGWSDAMGDKMPIPTRIHMKEYLRQQGFYLE